MKSKLTSIAALGIALAMLTTVLALLGQHANAKTADESPARQTGLVTVAGIVGADQLQPVFDEFTSRTGNVVTYSGDWGLEEFNSCVANENCPDVGLVPQPGLMQDLATAGALAELTPFIDTTVLNANYADTWIDLGKVDGTLYGVWFNASNKSLVWYDPTEFSSHGWMTATNWTELLALSDEILSTTSTPPWSIGNESDEATGWPLTDWFEDILLRSAGPQIYDQLIAHDIPWTHPEVLSAMTYFGDILGNEAYQLGGKSGTLNTWFGDAIMPLFREPPEAYLHRQGTFASNFIDPAQTPGIDYAVFAFPEIDPAYADAVMGSGDIAIVFSATVEAQSLINFLITTDAAEIWVAGGNSSPNRNVDFGLYTDPILRAAAQQMANADIFRFDLSDQLPSDLNAFVWSQMDDLVWAAPDPDAMRAVLTRIEIHASGAHSIYLPMVVSNSEYDGP
jgi:alpha-glucoside transport system substrate-binding protein